MGTCCSSSEEPAQSEIDDTRHNDKKDKKDKKKKNKVVDKEKYKKNKSPEKGLTK